MRKEPSLKVLQYIEHFSEGDKHTARIGDLTQKSANENPSHECCDAIQKNNKEVYKLEHLHGFGASAASKVIHACGN